MNRIKIKFNGIHFCYLNERLCIRFLEKTECASLRQWIKQETEERLHISPCSKEEIFKIQTMLSDMYYDSPGEWIQELMRNRIKEN